MTTNSTTNAASNQQLEPKLLPCPFCGVVPAMQSHTQEDEMDDGRYMFFVECGNSKCPMGLVSTGGPYRSEADVAKPWNTRSRVSAGGVVATVDESGWLLEKMHNGNVHYIAADYVLEWTDDPNKALRLARRADAEALCIIVEDCEKIASHEWPATASPAALVEQSDIEQPTEQNPTAAMIAYGNKRFRHGLEIAAKIADEMDARPQGADICEIIAAIRAASPAAPKEEAPMILERTGGRSRCCNSTVTWSHDGPICDACKDWAVTQ